MHLGLKALYYSLRYLNYPIACMVWLFVEFTCSRCVKTLYKLSQTKRKRMTDLAEKLLYTFYEKKRLVRKSSFEDEI